MMNKNNDLEELMKKATEKSNFEHENKKNDKSTTRVIIFALVGMIIFGGSLLAGYFMIDVSTDFVDKTEDPEWVNKTKENPSDNQPQVSEIKRPIELHEWAQLPYDRKTFWDKENIESEVLKISQEELRGFYSSISWMKSGVDHGFDDPKFAKPYTNEISQRYEEGSDRQNPRFSYTLLEDYEKAFVVYTERLLNPTFGGWGMAQQYENQSGLLFGGLKDIFTSEWWSENIESQDDFSRLPVFAEWTEGSWDHYNLYNEGSLYSPFFYGKIKETIDKSIKVEVLGIDEESQNIVRVSAPIEYHAFNNDKEIVTATGTLELTMHSNLEFSEVENRVVVSNAKLTLDK